LKRARKSLRLKGYDYAQAGAYFVTICGIVIILEGGDTACRFPACRISGASSTANVWSANSGISFYHHVVI